MAQDCQANIEKVKRIFDAAMERRKAFLAGDLSMLKDEPFYDIYDERLGSLSIGREAMSLLDELAIAAIETAGLGGRVAITTARNALGSTLVRLIIHDRQPLQAVTVRRAFKEAAAEFGKALTTHTYIFPCHIADSSDPSTITLGPVTFLNRPAASGLLRTTLKNTAASAQKLDAQDRKLMTAAIRYYRQFKWLATVRIENCDPKVAAEYALSTATLAVSGLQLFLGARSSQSMKLGGEALGWSKTAQLKITAHGIADFSVTTAYRGGASFPEGWSSELSEPGMQLGMKLLGVALEASLPGVDRPLSNRFLAAVQWYGEAVREKIPSTRFIKFITAIEHLLLSGERDGLTGLLSRRAAALTYEIGSIESRQAAEAEFRRLYNLRSRLIHGDLPPWSEKARHDLAKAADLAESILHAALNAWREKGLLSKSATSKKMRQWFNETVWMMVEATEPVDHLTRRRQFLDASK